MSFRDVGLSGFWLRRFRLWQDGAEVGIVSIVRDLCEA